MNGTPPVGRPTVSVVVPTHFRNERLAAALDSVGDQTLDGVETVVVDYVAFEENRGANAARTVGVERTTGRYVQFLDDDDRLAPEKLERQVDLLESSPNVGVAYCGMRFETGRVVSPDLDARGNVLDRALAFDLYPCLTSTMLAERGVVEDVLPMRDRPGADDLGWMIELARHTAFDFVPAPLVERGVIRESRGKSLGVYRGRRTIVEEYADLYEAFPPRVRATALADTERFRGWTLLTARGWSAGAVRSYGHAVAHEPSVYNLGLLLASLLGRPGVVAGSRLSDALGRWRQRPGDGATRPFPTRRRGATAEPDRPGAPVPTGDPSTLGRGPVSMSHLEGKHQV